MDTLKQYWDKKFRDKSFVWGKEPSESSKRVVNFLDKNNFKNLKILDLACGYGRDSDFFKRNGHRVTGIDISEEGIRLAEEIYDSMEFVAGDIFNMPFKNDSYDLIFGNFILHLFFREYREKMLKEVKRVLKPSGYAAFCVASDQDDDYGKGEEKEKDCFVNDRGVVKYYYSIDSIKDEFSEFSDLIINDIEEHHVHDGPHVHKSHLIIARKKGENQS